MSYKNAPKMSREIFPAGRATVPSRKMAESQQRFAAGDRSVEVYPKEDGVAKLGTKRRPAVVRVRTEERAMEILDLCNEHGIQVIIGVEPDEQENISDVECILSPPVPAKTPPHVGRNDYCPCGSGKKYKKCCAGLTAGA
jgi:SWIM/SEC-C metal-binding protein